MLFRITFTGAYLNKFNISDDTEEDDLDEDEIDENIPIGNNNSDEDVLYRVPHLGFQVTIQVECAVAYAPWLYVRNLDTKDFNASRRSKVKGMTDIQLNFECFGASYPRLPERFHYHFRPKDDM